MWYWWKGGDDAQWLGRWKVMTDYCQVKHLEVCQPAWAAVIGYVTDTDTTQPCLVFLATCWTGCSPFSMRQRALSVTRGSMTMSLICSMACTGCVFWTEYISDWPCLSSAVLSQHGASLSHPRPVLDWRSRSATMSAFRLSPMTDYSLNANSQFALLVTGHSVWQRHAHAAFFLLVSLQHLQWQYSKDNWKHSCLRSFYNEQCDLDKWARSSKSKKEKDKK